MNRIKKNTNDGTNDNDNYSKKKTNPKKTLVNIWQ